MAASVFWTNTKKQLLEFLFGNPVGTAALLLSFILPLAILIYQNRDAETQRNIAKAERRSSLFIEVTNSRERSDTELKAEMFKALISLYFGDGTKHENNEDHTAILGVLAWNFQDHLDTAPLFALLDSKLRNGVCPDEKTADEITESGGSCMTPLRDQLRQTSEAVISHQVSTILSQGEMASISEIVTLCIEEFEDICGSQGYFYFDGGRPVVSYQEAPPRENLGDRYFFRLTEVSETGMELNVMRIAVGDEEDLVTPFIISRFSPPYTTHYNMRNSRKVALWINDLNARDGVATFRILVFPQDYISTARRPTLADIAERLEIEE